MNTGIEIIGEGWPMLEGCDAYGSPKDGSNRKVKLKLDTLGELQKLRLIKWMLKDKPLLDAIIVSYNMPRGGYGKDLIEFFDKKEAEQIAGIEEVGSEEEE